MSDVKPPLSAPKIKPATPMSLAPEFTSRPIGMEEDDLKAHKLVFGHDVKFKVSRDTTGEIEGYDAVETGIGSPGNETYHHKEAKARADDSARSRTIKLAQEEALLEVLLRQLKGKKDED